MIRREPRQYQGQVALARGRSGCASRLRPTGGHRNNRWVNFYPFGKGL